MYLQLSVAILYQVCPLVFIFTPFKITHDRHMVAWHEFIWLSMGLKRGGRRFNFCEYGYGSVRTTSTSTEIRTSASTSTSTSTSTSCYMFIINIHIQYDMNALTIATNCFTSSAVGIIADRFAANPYCSLEEHWLPRI